jgi:RyR domain
MKYEPKPLDTSAVVLPPDVLALTEKLAENTHEVWARGRLLQGWTFGPVRDDASKKHPCLIPYADLPESEKEYDRNTAIEALKAVLALGYVVSKRA